jgi:hypothetical protein
MSDIIHSETATANELSKDLPLPVHGWRSEKLPELATNGFPLSPSFIVRDSGCTVEHQPVQTDAAQPFGFHFRQWRDTTGRPVIDLTKGYYDPHTQTYILPLRINGETEGGEYLSGEWTETADGDKPIRVWDTMKDRDTD